MVLQSNEQASLASFGQWSYDQSRAIPEVFKAIFPLMAKDFEIHVDSVCLILPFVARLLYYMINGILESLHVKFEGDLPEELVLAEDLLPDEIREGISLVNRASQ